MSKSAILLGQILITLLVLSTAITGNVAIARDGDTLEPIAIDTPPLVTYPSNLLNEEDARLIAGRIQEARNSGVPLAVRIVDVSQNQRGLPAAVRTLLPTEEQPVLAELQAQALLEAWIKAEPVETAPGAGDGFLLLVLVPANRTDTQVLWFIGPNALPLNGLTADNIEATQTVMKAQFAAGNMPNGIYLGVSEFSYNIQFGTPERLARTSLPDALHKAMYPIALLVTLSGLAIPALAWKLSRNRSGLKSAPLALTPWQAAAISMGRAHAEIPAAMLMVAHQKASNIASPNALRLTGELNARATESMRPFTNDSGDMAMLAEYEIEAVLHPVRVEIEESLVASGAMISTAQTDRVWMLSAMGISTFMVLLTLTPTIKSMSDAGVLAILLAMVGIAFGWVWLARRSYTTSHGKQLLQAWLEQASPRDRYCFDLATQQDLLTIQAGGPHRDSPMKLMRRFRGLGAS